MWNWQQLTGLFWRTIKRTHWCDVMNTQTFLGVRHGRTRWTPKDVCVGGYNLGQIKMKNETPLPPQNQWWIRAQSKTRHFSIIEMGRGGGGGLNFSFHLSKIVAGFWKTTTIGEMIIDEEKLLLLAYTNKAVENVKNKLKNKYSGNVNDICHTFDSYFCEWKSEKQTVFLEFRMIPNKWMSKIYRAFVDYNIKVCVFGDSNQWSSVEGGSQIYCDYKEMCPQRITLKYNSETLRYDTLVK